MTSFALPRRGFLVGALLASLVSGAAHAEGPAAVTAPVTASDTAVTVFAAASLTNALEDVAKLLKEKKGIETKYSFAASSTLAKQIESGAPVNVFASADQKWMDYLSERNLIVNDTRVTVLGNALVMVAPLDKAKPVTIDGKLDLDALLGPNGRIATGLVDSVPVGVYAKTALTNLGLWEKAGPRIVGAESVRAALALVERGEVPVGIVYDTDAAISKNVKVIGVFPASSHPPVEYPFAIVKGQDTPAARAFLAFVQTPEAVETFKKYGFSKK